MQFIDLQAQYQALKTEIDEGIQQVLNAAQFISGPEVTQFEDKLASFTGRRHCITCANGTDALQIAYMACGIGQGDAIFCPDVTFIASIEPAYMLGATPVFCDITPDTYNLDAASLEKQITAVKDEGKLTPKAVVAVDFLGNPADYAAIESICQKYELLLIEDAAQGFGGAYRGRNCGAFGKIATTSFFPAKPLGCYGDGGAIFTDDDELAAVFRSICVHGKGPSGKYDNVRIGVNSRLDTLQAAILLSKLKALASYELEQRQKVAARYNEAFSPYFTTPFIAEGCISVYAQYAILAKDMDNRDQICRHLKEQGVPSMVYYPTPQHELPVFRAFCSYGETFVNSIDYCARTISLPMHPYLTEETQLTVINAVLGAIK